jgi:hypothetical protein
MSNALNSTADIMSYVDLVNKSPAGTINPEVFYDKQLLDTIRMDGAMYVYHRYADESPIQEKADKLVVKRWSPLQAHTVPLVEGTPPKSDKGSVEKYEMSAAQYGRYMEFTDKVNFAAVDPIIVHYTKEYSLVVMETLDILARNELFSKAQKFFAGDVALITDMRIATAKPKLADLRLIVLSLKKQMVKPRSNGKYHVITSPEFTFDMLDDDYIVKYMQYNQTTKTMFDNASMIPLFDMEFYETMVCPAHGRFVNGAGKKSIIACKQYNAGTDGAYVGTKDALNYVYRVFDETGGEYTKVSGYVKDSRTNQDASYIPDQDVWTLPAGWTELKIHHILMLGDKALSRTGLAGEGNAKMYVKPLGSSGVLDPIDQRQSIGFKINSVGYGSTRLEAIVDYLCIPTQANL